MCLTFLSMKYLHYLPFVIIGKGKAEVVVVSAEAPTVLRVSLREHYFESIIVASLKATVDALVCVLRVARRGRSGEREGVSHVVYTFLGGRHLPSVPLPGHKQRDLL